MEEILTSRFSVTPTVHARLALARRSVRFWMAVAAPLLILIIAGFYYDTRLLYVAAAVTFILIPTLLLIAWYSLLTRQSAINGMFPQSVLFGHDREISVRYYPLPTSADKDTTDSKEHTHRVPAELVIPFTEVTDCRVYGDYLQISYSGGNDLLIPISSFPTPEASTKIFRYFNPYFSNLQ